MAVTPLDLKAGFCIALVKNAENNTLTINSEDTLTVGKLSLDSSTGEIVTAPKQAFDVIIVSHDVSRSISKTSYYVKFDKYTSGGQYSSTITTYIKISGTCKYNVLKCIKVDSSTDDPTWSMVDSIDGTLQGTLQYGVYSVMGDSSGTTTITPNNPNVPMVIYINGTVGVGATISYYVKTSYALQDGELSGCTFEKIAGSSQYSKLSYNGSAEQWTLIN